MSGTNHKEFEELCAAFAIGALDGADRERLRAHLPTCSACRQRVAEFEESATWLALGLAPIQPSAQVKSAVMQRISGAHGPARRPGPGGGAGLLTYAALGLAGLAIASAAGMGLLYSHASRDLEATTEERDRLEVEVDALQKKSELLEQLTLKLKEREAEVVRVREDLARSEEQRAKLAEDYAAAMKDLDRLRRLERLLEDVETKVFAASKPNDPAAGSGRGRVLWNDRDVVVAVEDLPRLSDRSYQLWALAPGKAPQSVGLFPDLDRAGAVLDLTTLAASPGDVNAFAFSLEAPGGSKDPAGPQGPVVLVITP